MGDDFEDYDCVGGDEMDWKDKKVVLRIYKKSLSVFDTSKAVDIQFTINPKLTVLLQSSNSILIKWNLLSVSLQTEEASKIFSHINKLKDDNSLKLIHFKLPESPSNHPHPHPHQPSPSPFKVAVPRLAGYKANHMVQSEPDLPSLDHASPKVASLRTTPTLLHSDGSETMRVGHKPDVEDRPGSLTDRRQRTMSDRKFSLKKEKRQQSLLIYKSNINRTNLFAILKKGELEEKKCLEIVNDPTFRATMNEPDPESEQTVLYMACSTGNSKLVDILLRTDGINVNDVQDRVTNSTPLHVATWGGYTEIVAMLIARGAVPQSAGLNNNFPEKEMDANQGMDKEKRKKMEELWKAYGKNKKKDFLDKYLPEGRTIAQYKPEHQLPLEAVIVGLTVSEEDPAALELKLDNNNTADSRLKFMDILLTYRLYCSHDDFFSLLKKRYLQHDEDGPTDIGNKIRVLNITFHWITKLWQDFVDLPFYESMDRFLSSIVDTHKTELVPFASKQWQELKSIPQKIAKNDKILFNLPHDPPTHERKESVMSFPPQLIAQHLNAIDLSLWKQLKPTESWNISQLKSILKWSEHLSQLVSFEVLSSKDLCHRVDHIIKLLDVCEELLGNNKDKIVNLNSFMSILDALCKFQTTILWKGVPEDKKNKFNDYLKYFEKNFTYCTEQLKTMSHQKILLIPPVAVYNFYGLRWTEKQRLKQKARSGLTPIYLNQVKNAAIYFEIVLKCHEIYSTIALQTDLLNIISFPVPTERKKELTKELESPDYVEKEWNKALQNNDTRAAKLLLHHKPALISTKDSEGRNVVHVATCYNSESMVNYLLNYQKKTEISVVEIDKNQETALSVASKNGYSTILSLLLSYYELWHNELCKRSDKDTDSLFFRNQVKALCKREHENVMEVWQSWCAGGSKALESANFTVISSDHFPRSSKKRKHSALPSLDWNKFQTRPQLPLTPLGISVSNLITSEGEYLQHLILTLKFIKSITKDSLIPLSSSELEILSNGIVTMINFHKSLYEEFFMIRDLNNLKCIFDTLLDKSEAMKSLYSNYAKNYMAQMRLISKHKTSTSKVEATPDKNNQFTLDYLLKPILRILQYPVLLEVIYSLIEDDSSKKSYWSSVKSMQEVSTQVYDEFEKNKAKKVLSNLSPNTTLKTQKSQVVICGKLFSSSSQQKLIYVLFPDFLYGFSLGDGCFKVIEEYSIQSIKSVLAEDSAIKLTLFPSGSVVLGIDNVEKKTLWCDRLQKTREKFIIENGTMDLAIELVSGFDEEKLKKYWIINDKSKARCWVTLGDLLAKENKLSEALSAYDSAIKLKQSQYWAYYKQAKIYSKLGDGEKEYKCLCEIQNIMKHKKVDFKVVVNTLKLLQKFKPQTETTKTNPPQT